VQCRSFFFTFALTIDGDLFHVVPVRIEQPRGFVGRVQLSLRALGQLGNESLVQVGQLVA
jgi:hypothetical protein